MGRPKEVVSYNMSRIRSKGTKLEADFEQILKVLPYEYVKHPDVYGKPDFAFLKEKVAIFADSDFWHGYDWENKKREIKSNKQFWLPKIERNMERDKEVTQTLQAEGWTVIRLWGHDILKDPEKCKKLIIETLEKIAAKG